MTAVNSIYTLSYSVCHIQPSPIFDLMLGTVLHSKCGLHQYLTRVEVTDVTSTLAYDDMKLNTAGKSFKIQPP
jgi:hypothetical protein